MSDLLLHLMDQSLGRLYLEKGELELGIKHYDKYIEHLKTSVNSVVMNDNLQVLLKKATEEYHEILFKITRESFNAQNWLTTILCAQKLLNEGFKDNSLYKFLSFCYKELKQQDIRLAFIKQYEVVAQNDPEINKLIAEAYFDYNNKENAKIAISYLEKHLELHPDDPYTYNLIGHIYAAGIHKGTGYIDDQLKYFLKAKEIDPDNFVVLNNLIQTYVRSRQHEKAAEIYKELLAKHESRFDHHDYFNYAAFLIRKGDFIEGFKQYEHRRDDKNDEGTYFIKTDKEEWDGIKNIQNSTLLVHLEQGFGDNLLFVRLVNDVKKYAKKVIFQVQNELYDLMMESNLDFEIYPVKMDLKEIEFDYYIPLISLPRVLQITPETVTNRGGYLSASPKRIEDYAKAFIPDTNKFKLGINFQGADYGKEQDRDINWKFLEKFSNIENIQLYCINKNIGQDFFKNLNPNINIVCLGNSFKTFADTAAAIQNMDMMISTDNAILNLTGALGKKSIALLNFDYEYRWYNAESGRVVWYDNMISIVNERQNDWEPTVDKAIQEVLKYMQELGY